MAEEFNQNKPSYEQLVNYINQLERQLNDQRLGEIVAQLNFLFKVIEFKDAFPEEYVKQCAQEVQNVLTIKTDKETAEDEPAGKVVKKTVKKSK